MESSSDLVLTFVVVLDHVHKRSIFCTPMSLTGPNYLTYTCISWPRYDRWCTGGHWIQMNYFSRCQGNLSLEKNKMVILKTDSYQSAKCLLQIFHQRNLYKIKTSKNPDLCYGCVQVKPNSVYRLCEQGMYRGSLSVVNWWFALCQAVWWCL